jgi:hypothetical protein
MILPPASAKPPSTLLNTTRIPMIFAMTEDYESWRKRTTGYALVVIGALQAN